MKKAIFLLAFSSWLLVSGGSVYGGVFNVRDYGVVGDDKTDNTPAFSKCMDAIQTDARNAWQTLVSDVNDPQNLGTADINYRYARMAKAEGVVPPVKGPMLDSARALQFVRSKAKEWNLDKQRVGAAGGSAGGCSSLWLAYHDDLADPKSADPVARESTRLFCAAVKAPQTTLDPKQMKEWTPNSTYGGHAFGLNSFDQFLANREKIMPWIKEYSPYELVSAGDPPVYLFYETPPNLGRVEKDPTHTANFGLKLQEQCASNHLPCELVYPGAPDVTHPTLTDYLIAMLKTGLKMP